MQELLTEIKECFGYDWTGEKVFRSDLNRSTYEFELVQIFSNKLILSKNFERNENAVATISVLSPKGLGDFMGIAMSEIIEHFDPEEHFIDAFLSSLGSVVGRKSKENFVDTRKNFCVCSFLNWLEAKDESYASEYNENMRKARATWCL